MGVLNEYPFFVSLMLSLSLRSHCKQTLIFSIFSQYVNRSRTIYHILPQVVVCRSHVYTVELVSTSEARTIVSVYRALPTQNATNSGIVSVDQSVNRYGAIDQLFRKSISSGRSRTSRERGRVQIIFDYFAEKTHEMKENLPLPATDQSAI